MIEADGIAGGTGIAAFRRSSLGTAIAASQSITRKSRKRVQATLTGSYFLDFTCWRDVALRIVAGKWKPLLVYFLLSGPKRYSELRRTARGVSDKMLIQHLKELDKDGEVLRTDPKAIPSRIDDALTPLGRSLT